MWLLFRCPQVTCAADETNVWVQETAGCKPWQTPCLCVRCRTPLVWDSFADR
jgi:hypothetical protein